MSRFRDSGGSRLAALLRARRVDGNLCRKFGGFCAAFFSRGVMVSCLLLLGCEGPQDEASGSGDIQLNARVPMASTGTSSPKIAISSRDKVHPKWVFETSESAVTGRQVVATLRLPMDRPRGAFKSIEVRCLSETHELATLLTLEGVDDLYFASEFGKGVKGYLRTVDMPVARRGHPATAEDFRNQAKLKPIPPTLNSEMSVEDSVLARDVAYIYLNSLPIALSLETSAGAVEFIVPANDDIKELAEDCIDRPRIERAIAEAEEELQRAKQRLSEKYAREIRDSIMMSWIYPESVRALPRCRVMIEQVRGGMVRSVEIDEGCLYDAEARRSVEAAVQKAQPLPYAGFESVFVRDITLNFEARDH